MAQYLSSTRQDTRSLATAGVCLTSPGGAQGQTCSDLSTCDVDGGCNGACGSGTKSNGEICDVPNGYCQSGYSCRPPNVGSHLSCSSDQCVNNLCPNGASSCGNECSSHTDCGGGGGGGSSPPASPIAGACTTSGGAPGQTCADLSTCDVDGGCNGACGSGTKSNGEICDVPNGYCKSGYSCRQATTGTHLGCVNNTCVNTLCPAGVASCANDCSACGGGGGGGSSPAPTSVPRDQCTFWCAGCGGFCGDAGVGRGETCTVQQNNVCGQLPCWELGTCSMTCSYSDAIRTTAGGGGCSNYNPGYYCNSDNNCRVTPSSTTGGTLCLGEGQGCVISAACCSGVCDTSSPHVCVGAGTPPTGGASPTISYNCVPNATYCSFGQKFTCNGGVGYSGAACPAGQTCPNGKTVCETVTTAVVGTHLTCENGACNKRVNCPNNVSSCADVCTGCTGTTGGTGTISSLLGLGATCTSHAQCQSGLLCSPITTGSTTKACAVAGSTTTTTAPVVTYVSNCTPGTTCSAGELKTCASDARTLTTKICTSKTCNLTNTGCGTTTATTTLQGVGGSCNKGPSYCDRDVNVVYKCTANYSGYNVSRCPTGTTCKSGGTSCTATSTAVATIRPSSTPLVGIIAKTCVKNTTICSKNSLSTCNSLGNGYITKPCTKCNVDGVRCDVLPVVSTGASVSSAAAGILGPGKTCSSTKQCTAGLVCDTYDFKNPNFKLCAKGASGPTVKTPLSTTAGVDNPTITQTRGDSLADCAKKTPSERLTCELIVRQQATAACAGSANFERKEDCEATVLSLGALTSTLKSTYTSIVYGGWGSKIYPTAPITPTPVTSTSSEGKKHFTASNNYSAETTLSGCYKYATVSKLACLAEVRKKAATSCTGSTQCIDKTLGIDPEVALLQTRLDLVTQFINITDEQLVDQRCRDPLLSQDRKDDCQADAKANIDNLAAKKAIELGLTTLEQERAVDIRTSTQTTNKAINDYLYKPESELATECADVPLKERTACVTKFRNQLLSGLDEDTVANIKNQEKAMLAWAAIGNYQNSTFVDFAQIRSTSLNTRQAEYEAKCGKAELTYDEREACKILDAELGEYYSSGSVIDSNLVINQGDAYLISQCKTLSGTDCSTADAAKRSLLTIVAASNPELSGNSAAIAAYVNTVAPKTIPLADASNAVINQQLKINVAENEWWTNVQSYIGNASNNLGVALGNAGAAYHNMGVTPGTSNVNFANYNGFNNELISYQAYRPLDYVDTANVYNLALASLKESSVSDTGSAFYDPEEAAKFQLQAAKLGIDTTSDAVLIAAAADPLYWQKKAAALQQMRSGLTAQALVINYNQFTDGRFREGNAMMEEGRLSGDIGKAFTGALIQGSDAAAIVTSVVAIPLGGSATFAGHTLGFGVGTRAIVATGVAGVGGTTYMAGTTARTCAQVETGLATQADCNSAMAMLAFSAGSTGLSVIQGAGTAVNTARAAEALGGSTSIGRLTNAVGELANANAAIIQKVQLGTSGAGTVLFANNAIKTCSEGSELDCAAGLAVAVSSGVNFASQFNVPKTGAGVGSTTTTQAAPTQIGKTTITLALSEATQIAGGCAGLLYSNGAALSDQLNNCALNIIAADNIVTAGKFTASNSGAGSRTGAPEIIAIKPVTPDAPAKTIDTVKPGETVVKTAAENAAERIVASGKSEAQILADATAAELAARSKAGKDFTRGYNELVARAGADGEIKVTPEQIQEIADLNSQVAKERAANNMGLTEKQTLKILAVEGTAPESGKVVAPPEAPVKTPDQIAAENKANTPPPLTPEKILSDITSAKIEADKQVAVKQAELAAAEKLLAETNAQTPKISGTNGEAIIPPARLAELKTAEEWVANAKAELESATKSQVEQTQTQDTFTKTIEAQTKATQEALAAYDKAVQAAKIAAAENILYKLPGGEARRVAEVAKAEVAAKEVLTKTLAELPTKTKNPLANIKLPGEITPDTLAKIATEQIAKTQAEFEAQKAAEISKAKETLANYSALDVGKAARAGKIEAVIFLDRATTTSPLYADLVAKQKAAKQALAVFGQGSAEHALTTRDLLLSHQQVQVDILVRQKLSPSSTVVQFFSDFSVGRPKTHSDVQLTAAVVELAKFSQKTLTTPEEVAAYRAVQDKIITAKQDIATQAKLLDQGSLAQRAREGLARAVGQEDPISKSLRTARDEYYKALKKSAEGNASTTDSTTLAQKDSVVLKDARTKLEQARFLAELNQSNPKAAKAALHLAVLADAPELQKYIELSSFSEEQVKLTSKNQAELSAVEKQRLIELDQLLDTEAIRELSTLVPKFEQRVLSESSLTAIKEAAAGTTPINKQIEQIFNDLSNARPKAESEALVKLQDAHRTLSESRELSFLNNIKNPTPEQSARIVDLNKNSKIADLPAKEAKLNTLKAQQEAESNKNSPEAQKRVTGIQNLEAEVLKPISDYHLALDAVRTTVGAATSPEGLVRMRSISEGLQQIDVLTSVETLLIRKNAAIGDASAIAAFERGITDLTQTSQIRIPEKITNSKGEEVAFDTQTRLELMDVISDTEHRLATVQSGTRVSRASQVEIVMRFLSSRNTAVELTTSGGKTMVGVITLKARMTLGNAETGIYLSKEGKQADIALELNQVTSHDETVAILDSTRIAEPGYVKDFLKAKYVVMGSSDWNFLNDIILDPTHPQFSDANKIFDKLTIKVASVADEAQLTLDGSLAGIMTKGVSIPPSESQISASRSVAEVLQKLKILDSTNLLAHESSLNTKLKVGESETSVSRFNEDARAAIYKELAASSKRSLAELEIIRTRGPELEKLLKANTPESNADMRAILGDQASGDIRAQVTSGLDLVDMVNTFGKGLATSYVRDIDPVIKRQLELEATRTGATPSDRYESPVSMPKSNGVASEGQTFSGTMKLAMEAIGAVQHGQEPNFIGLRSSDGPAIKSTISSWLTAVQLDPSNTIAAMTGTLGGNRGAVETILGMKIHASADAVVKQLGTIQNTTGNRVRADRSFNAVDVASAKKTVTDLYSSGYLSKSAGRDSHGNSKIVTILEGVKTLEIAQAAHDGLKVPGPAPEKTTFFIQENGHSYREVSIDAAGNVTKLGTLTTAEIQRRYQNGATNTITIIDAGGATGDSILTGDNVPGVNILRANTAEYTAAQAFARHDRGSGIADQYTVVLDGPIRSTDTAIGNTPEQRLAFAKDSLDFVKLKEQFRATEQKQVLDTMTEGLNRLASDSVKRPMEILILLARSDAQVRSWAGEKLLSEFSSGSSGRDLSREDIAKLSIDRRNEIATEGSQTWAKIISDLELPENTLLLSKIKQQYPDVYRSMIANRDFFITHPEGFTYAVKVPAQEATTSSTAAPADQPTTPTNKNTSSQASNDALPGKDSLLLATDLASAADLHRLMITADMESKFVASTDLSPAKNATLADAIKPSIVSHAPESAPADLVAARVETANENISQVRPTDISSWSHIPSAFASAFRGVGVFFTSQSARNMTAAAMQAPGKLWNGFTTAVSQAGTALAQIPQLFNPPAPVAKTAPIVSNLAAAGTGTTANTGADPIAPVAITEVVANPAAPAEEVVAAVTDGAVSEVPTVADASTDTSAPTTPVAVTEVTADPADKTAVNKNSTTDSTDVVTPIVATLPTTDLAPATATTDDSAVKSKNAKESAPTSDSDATTKTDVAGTGGTDTAYNKTTTSIIGQIDPAKELEAIIQTQQLLIDEQDTLDSGDDRWLGLAVKIEDLQLKIEQLINTVNSYIPSPEALDYFRKQVRDSDDSLADHSARTQAILIKTRDDLEINLSTNQNLIDALKIQLTTSTVETSPAVFLEKPDCIVSGHPSLITQVYAQDGSTVSGSSGPCVLSRPDFIGLTTSAIPGLFPVTLYERTMRRALPLLNTLQTARERQLTAMGTAQLLSNTVRESWAVSEVGAVTTDIPSPVSSIVTSHRRITEQVRDFNLIFTEASIIFEDANYEELQELNTALNRFIGEVRSGSLYGDDTTNLNEIKELNSKVNQKLASIETSAKKSANYLESMIDLNSKSSTPLPSDQVMAIREEIDNIKSDKFLSQMPKLSELVLRMENVLSEHSQNEVRRELLQLALRESQAVALSTIPNARVFTQYLSDFRTLIEQIELVIKNKNISPSDLKKLLAEYQSIVPEIILISKDTNGWLLNYTDQTLASISAENQLEEYAIFLWTTINDRVKIGKRLFELAKNDERIKVLLSDTGTVSTIQAGSSIRERIRDKINKFTNNIRNNAKQSIDNRNKHLDYQALSPSDVIGNQISTGIKVSKDDFASVRPLTLNYAAFRAMGLDSTTRNTRSIQVYYEKDHWRVLLEDNNNGIYKVNGQEVPLEHIQKLQDSSYFVSAGDDSDYFIFRPDPVTGELQITLNTSRSPEAKTAPVQVTQNSQTAASSEHPDYNADAGQNGVTESGIPYQIVADGVGSGKEDSVAVSQETNKIMVETYENLTPTDKLSVAINKITAGVKKARAKILELRKKSNLSPEVAEQIDTTLNTGFIWSMPGSNRKFWININLGDSQSYLYRPTTGEFKELSRAHSLVSLAMTFNDPDTKEIINVMLKDPRTTDTTKENLRKIDRQLSADEAFNMPGRNIILNAVGNLSQDDAIDITITELQDGDLILGSSDGPIDNFIPSEFRKKILELYAKSWNHTTKRPDVGYMVSEIMKETQKNQKANLKHNDRSYSKSDDLLFMITRVSLGNTQSE